ncbi:MAG: response regulator [Rhodoferax sp.]|nr:response regulator [Rhodoferax sp.]HQZ04456.1 response regulator [Burkholderiaceae bacterium]
MGIRVLIVEDEANIVESVSFILRREGLEVSSVADGDAALERLRGGHPPALVILDVMLPRRNGFEVLRALKSDARLSAIPVIMLTAKAQPHDRARADEAGADAYITKPFSNRDLVEQVKRLCGG